MSYCTCPHHKNINSVSEDTGIVLVANETVQQIIITRDGDTTKMIVIGNNIDISTIAIGVEGDTLFLRPNTGGYVHRIDQKERIKKIREQ